MQPTESEGSAPVPVVLSVPGMMCRHCVRAISSHVRDVPGVDTVEADLLRGTVCIWGTAGVDEVRRAVADAGYEAIPMTG